LNKPSNTSSNSRQKPITIFDSSSPFSDNSFSSTPTNIITNTTANTTTNTTNTTSNFITTQQNYFADTQDYWLNGPRYSQKNEISPENLQQQINNYENASESQNENIDSGCEIVTIYGNNNNNNSNTTTPINSIQQTNFVYNSIQTQQQQQQNSRTKSIQNETIDIKNRPNQIRKLKIGPYVVSVETINTKNEQCLADFLVLWQSQKEYSFSLILSELEHPVRKKERNKKERKK